jgi:hypothetical protein
MMRVSKLSSPEDFVVERWREEIRNSRCRRYISIVLSIALAVHLSGADDSHLVATLLQALPGS